MQHTGLEQFTGEQPPAGVLITNLGTPQAPTARALRSYLKEFLSDPRVVEFPRALWWVILNGIILHVRPRRSARLYASVWTDQGPPLLVNLRAQQQALAEKLQGAAVVELAMRYGEPSIDSVISQMLKKGVRRLLVLPLYPQYSGATTGSTFDAVAASLFKMRSVPALRFINNYYDFPAFIDACTEHIGRHREQVGTADKLLFSYHGVPKRYLLAGDPYHGECLKTSRLLAERLGLNENDYMTTFQSRFGREEWLRPYTDETLKALPGQGVSSIQVFCPGFSADCLETLEEIAQQNRGFFLDAGGSRFDYIPCLNAEPCHINALEKLIRSNLAGWDLEPETPGND